MKTNKIWQRITFTLVPLIMLTACPQGDFLLSSASQHISITQGSNQQISIHLERRQGFQDSVALSLLGAPTGVTGTFSPASISANTSQLTLNVSSSATIGSDDLIVSGTGGTLTRTTPLTLNITSSNTNLPTINSFTATPSSLSAAGSVTLQWNISNATGLTIDQGVGSVTPITTGSKTITLNTTTSFGLTATNTSGSSTANITVNVGSTSGQAGVWDTSSWDNANWQ